VGLRKLAPQVLHLLALSRQATQPQSVVICLCHRTLTLQRSGHAVIALMFVDYPK
jgi:hypothetical protein